MHRVDELFFDGYLASLGRLEARHELRRSYCRRRRFIASRLVFVEALAERVDELFLDGDGATFGRFEAKRHWYRRVGNCMLLLLLLFVLLVVQVETLTHGIDSFLFDGYGETLGCCKSSHLHRNRHRRWRLVLVLDGSDVRHQLVVVVVLFIYSGNSTRQMLTRQCPLTRR